MLRLTLLTSAFTSQLSYAHCLSVLIALKERLAISYVAIFDVWNPPLLFGPFFIPAGRTTEYRRNRWSSQLGLPVAVVHTVAYH